MDTPDPQTGLTPREKKAIRTSWDLVSEDLEGNGVSFLIKFFHDYPNDQNYFKSFKDNNPDNLRGNPTLCAHASTVMNALGSIVESLDNPGGLVDLLKTNAHNHHERGVRLPQYKNLFKTFVEYLSLALGPKCSDVTREAWEKALGVVATVIEVELSQLAINQKLANRQVSGNSTAQS